MTRRRPTGTRSAPWWKVARLLIVAALLAPPIAMGAGTVVATSAAADAPAVTVPGPTVNPGSTVTVEKTEDLVNEVVRVRWTGFTPSVYHLTTPGQFSEGNTRYPVRVYQCRGTDPDRPGQCYGSQIYEYPGRTDLFPNYFLGIPDGPQNYVQTATAADGTGSVDLEVRTIIESSTLGCTAASACSIVVVPNYGHPTERDPSYPQFPACATIFDFQSLRTCQGEFGDPDAPYGNSIDATWAWDNRVVVPISFAQTGETCPFGDAQVAAIGAPQAARAVASWQPVACTQDAAVDFDYTAQSEVLARNNFLNGLKDIGLTHRPADPDAATERTYTYAPVTTSAVAIAFRVDDAATFQRIEDMKLSPRLIAKMITQSYGWAGSWFDNPATEGNPQSLFQDPEFLELNPGHTWPSDADSTNATPILMADLSDMTYELTRYLNADADARAFLDGEPDDWDMHVNTFWTDVLYPTETFEARDPNERVISAYQPIQGLRNVAAKLVSNAYPGVSTDLDPSGKNIKFGPGNTGIQPPGSRAFVAIVDTSNAAAFRFPTAQLLNAAGEFVAPTSDAMAAGVAAMTVNADGITRTADVSSTDPAAYPLTMIDYAMVPTSGLDDDTAEAAGRLLDYAAGPGQVPGQLFGGLPAGYLPLTADLVAQTETAAAAVRAQAGGPLPTTPPPASSSPPPRSGSSSGPGGGFPPGSPGSSGSSGAVPGGGSAPTGPTQTTGPSAAGSTSPVAAAGAQRPVGSDSPAWIKYVLPVVLAIGLAAALLGTGTSWIVGRGGIAVPAVLPAPSHARTAAALFVEDDTRDRRRKVTVTATLERRSTPQERQAAEMASPPATRTAPATPARSRRAQGAIAVATALALLGALLLGFFAYLFLLSPIQQSRTQENLYKTLAEQLSLAVAPIDGVIPMGVPVALVEIPALGIRQVVVEGTTSGALMNGPGHRRDTVLPGQAGVAVIAGRSGLFGAPFAGLKDLQLGDEIVVTTGQARSTFSVTGLRDSDDPIPPPTTAIGKLSLSTADPPLAPSLSVIVSADLTSAVQPGSPDTGAIGTEERSLAGDTAAVLPLMLWAQVLLLAVAATSWGYLRWLRWPTYVISTPVLIAVLWNVYENVAQLLPNTM